MKKSLCIVSFIILLWISALSVSAQESKREDLLSVKVTSDGSVTVSISPDCEYFRALYDRVYIFKKDVVITPGSSPDWPLPMASWHPSPGLTVTLPAEKDSPPDTRIFSYLDTEPENIVLPPGEYYTVILGENRSFLTDPIYFEIPKTTVQRTPVPKEQLLSVRVNPDASVTITVADRDVFSSWERVAIYKKGDILTPGANENPTSVFSWQPDPNDMATFPDENGLAYADGEYPIHKTSPLPALPPGEYYVLVTSYADCAMTDHIYFEVPEAVSTPTPTILPETPTPVLTPTSTPTPDPTRPVQTPRIATPTTASTPSVPAASPHQEGISRKAGNTIAIILSAAALVTAGFATVLLWKNKKK